MMLETERLLLREYTEDDFPLFRSVYCDADIMRYAYAEVYKSEEDARSGFNKVLSEYRKDDRDYCDLAVLEKSGGCYVGSGGFLVHMKNDDGGVAEIGYFLLRPYWGRGYASELAVGLTDHCFHALGFHKVCASCNGLNSRSENVMKRCGMTKEGVIRQIRHKNGQWYDEIRYGMLREEWAGNIST